MPNLAIDGRVPRQGRREPEEGDGVIVFISSEKGRHLAVLLLYASRGAAEIAEKKGNHKGDQETQRSQRPIWRALRAKISWCPWCLLCALCGSPFFLLSAITPAGVRRGAVPWLSRRP